MAAGPAATAGGAAADRRSRRGRSLERTVPSEPISGSFTASGTKSAPRGSFRVGVTTAKTESWATVVLVAARRGAA